MRNKTDRAPLPALPTPSLPTVPTASAKQNGPGPLPALPTPSLPTVPTASAKQNGPTPAPGAHRHRIDAPYTGDGGLGPFCSFDSAPSAPDWRPGTRVGTSESGAQPPVGRTKIFSEGPKRPWTFMKKKRHSRAKTRCETKRTDTPYADRRHCHRTPGGGPWLVLFHRECAQCARLVAGSEGGHLRIWRAAPGRAH
jgi:hypothetical protein